jgi:hypothetical protein
VDNVFLGNRSCDQVPGGLVEGVVTDGNTGAGVNGATVTSVSTPSQTATTAPTTGDLSIGDGFYHMFMPATGSQQFTAAKKGYATLTKSLSVAADGVAALNLTLQAGQLSITPGSVSATVGMGNTATKNLTFKDTGQAPVTVKLTESPVGFTVLGQQGNGAPIERVHGTFSPLSASLAKKATRGASQPAAQPYDAPWTTVANYPTAIMDNGVATDTATGLVYSFGGYDGKATTAAAYVYDPGTQQWTALPSMKYPREAPQAAFIGGKLYVTGGWGSDGKPVAVTEVFDPSAGTWSTGASIPTPYAGAAFTTLNGELYVIGGCDANNCGHTDVQIYDPDSNSWSTGADYPSPSPGKAVGASAVTSTAVAASHRRRPTPPTHSLTMPRRTAGHASPRSRSTCGPWGTPRPTGSCSCPAARPASTWSATSDTPTTRHRAHGRTCPAPTTSTTAAAAPAASTASAAPPSAWIRRTSPSSSPATAAAASPARLGCRRAITGTVSGTSCGGSTAPISSATVQVNGGASSYTLKANGNGLYALWLDVHNNPLTLIAAKDSWQPQTATVKIAKGATTTANFALKPDSC